MLDKIRKRPHEFRSTDTGNVAALSDCSAPDVLTLKKGAQVMVIRNLSRNIVNGTVGVVRDFVLRDRIELPVIEVIDTSGDVLAEREQSFKMDTPKCRHVRIQSVSEMHCIRSKMLIPLGFTMWSLNGF